MAPFCKYLVLLTWAIGVASGPSKIVNGEELKPGKYPYIVSLQQNLPSGNHDAELCGASIIDEEWVLSSAHCHEEFEPPLSILAGAIRTDANETETVQRINVVDIRPYPVAKNDLALMKLERKVSLQPGTTEKIRIAASKWAYDPDEVFIMGWGQTSRNRSGNGSTVLKGYAATQIDSERCKGARTRLSEYLCFEPVDGISSACGGDSGSPIVARRTFNSEIVQISLVNGPGGTKNDCDAITGQKTAGNLLSNYCDWIEGTIGKKICVDVFDFE